MARGDRVELRHRTYEVVKIKAKGGHAKVTVRGGGSVFESEVRLADKVRVVATPLHDKTGAQQRWAKPSETAATTPPAEPGADPWETRRDKVERRLDELLGAHLVGEATDEDAGYYVPPVDVSTVDAHLVLFHGWQRSDWDEDTDRVRAHAAEHADRLADPGDFAPLKVNHWHTETRPAEQ